MSSTSTTSTLDVGLPADQQGLVVVTGAARGTGRAIAEAFGRQGRELILCDRDSTADVEASIKASLPVPPSVTSLTGDITDPDYPAKVIAALHGRKIALFAHAAPGGGDVPPSSSAADRGGGPKLFDVNFTASQRFVEALQPHMEPGDGTMVLVGSSSLSGATLVARNFLVTLGAKRHVRGHWSPTVWLLSRWAYTSYAISKRCVQLYVINKSRELASEGLRIVTVAPGVIDTAMQAFIGSTEGIPGRMRKSAEVASVVESLGPSSVTDDNVSVDGGLRAKKRTSIRSTLSVRFKSPPPGKLQEEEWARPG